MQVKTTFFSKKGKFENKRSKNNNRNCVGKNGGGRKNDNSRKK